MTPTVNEPRDRQAYALARAYLLGLSSQGVTEKLLDHYLSPRPSGKGPKTMSPAMVMTRTKPFALAGESIAGA